MFAVTARIPTIVQYGTRYANYIRQHGPKRKIPRYRLCSRLLPKTCSSCHRGCRLSVKSPTELRLICHVTHQCHPVRLIGSCAKHYLCFPHSWLYPILICNFRVTRTPVDYTARHSFLMFFVRRPAL
jgi:hypothetical protein